MAYGSATGNTLRGRQLRGQRDANTVTLTLQSGGGVNLAIVSTNPWGANGSLLTFTNSTTGGVLNLAFSGNAIIARAGQSSS